MFELRPRQRKLIRDLKKSISDGHKKIVLQAPCGFGKTVVITEIVNGAKYKNKKVLFLAPRKELISQCFKKLREYDIETGVLNNPSLANPFADVQLTCWQSLKKRNLSWKPDIVIYDECHGAVSEKAIEVLNRYHNAFHFGFTATPYRDDEKGLADFYQHLIKSCQTSDLIKEGYLIEPEYFNIDSIGSAEKAISFDSLESELAANEADVLIGADLIRNFANICGDAKTCVFCPSIDKAEEIAEKFRKAGFSAQSVDAKTAKGKREQILEDFANNKFQVICNAMLLKEGWDCPDLECVIFLRNLKSRVFYRQGAGRCMRLRKDGKSKKAYILDFFDCYTEFGGLPWDDEDYTLEEGYEKESKNKNEENNDNKPLICRECGFVTDMSFSTCSNCGKSLEKLKKIIAEAVKDLVKVKPTMDNKQQEFNRLAAICMDKGFSPYWVNNQYKKKFNVYPKGMVKTSIFKKYSDSYHRQQQQKKFKTQKLFA